MSAVTPNSNQDSIFNAAQEVYTLLYTQNLKKISDELTDKVDNLVIRLAEDPTFQFFINEVENDIQTAGTFINAKEIRAEEISANDVKESFNYLSKTCLNIEYARLPEQTKNLIKFLSQYLQVDSPLNSRMQMTARQSRIFTAANIESTLRDLKDSCQGNLVDLPIPVDSRMPETGYTTIQKELNTSRCFKFFFMEILCRIEQPFLSPEAIFRVITTIKTQQEIDSFRKILIALKLDLAMIVKDLIPLPDKPLIIYLTKKLLHNNFFPSGLDLNEEEFCLGILGIWEALFATGFDLNVKTIENNTLLDMLLEQDSEEDPYKKTPDDFYFQFALLAIDYGATINNRWVTSEQQQQIREALKSTPDPKINGITSKQIELVKRFVYRAYDKACESLDRSEDGLKRNGAVAAAISTSDSTATVDSEGASDAAAASAAGVATTTSSASSLSWLPPELIREIGGFDRFPVEVATECYNIRAQEATEAQAKAEAEAKAEAAGDKSRGEAAGTAEATAGPARPVRLAHRMTAEQIRELGWPEGSLEFTLSAARLSELARSAARASAAVRATDTEPASQRHSESAASQEESGDASRRNPDGSLGGAAAGL